MLQLRNVPSLLAICAFFVGSSHAVENVVDLGYAQFQGSVVDSQLQVSAWKGVQYAAPPVGNLRFAAPQDPVVTGLINATVHAPTCPPSRPDDWTVTGNYSRFSVAEDCLYLSVYASTKATVDSKLPVVVFFQGGGFTSQSSANWDPTDIVAGDQVVFVQFSYRVGLYGFLSSEAVKAGGGDVNAGIRDQIKLLEWVQENIAQFGGNPDHVVLDGVSAGGSSVMLMMTARMEKTPFVGGIAESGGWVTMRNAEQGEEQYECLLKDKNCKDAEDGLACLRALSEAEIRSTECWFNPNIDGDLYTDSLLNLFITGNYKRVPTIMGNCADEGTKGAPENLNSSTEALEWLADKDPTLSNASIAALDKMYIERQQPSFPGKGSYWRHASVAVGEIGSNCMIRNIQNALAMHGVPTYSYKYDVLDPKDEASGLGAWHTVNIYSFWGLKRTDGQDPPSYFDTNKPIISTVQAYWRSFIHNLDPSTDRQNGTAEWNPWTSSQSRERLFIQTNNTKIERMSPAESLRCDILRPLTNNLGKPPPNDAVTEFNQDLVARLNGTSESTELEHND